LTFSGAIIYLKLALLFFDYLKYSRSTIFHLVIMTSKTLFKDPTDPSS